jgi:prepilin-type N-terminal cleavage/methylation domain-containing protein
MLKCGGVYVVRRCVLADTGRKGFSLIEVLVVMGIVAILLAFTSIEFRRLMIRHDIESQVCELHGRLQRTRIEANTRNTAHFLRLEKDGYSVVADTWPDLFGNGKLDNEDRVMIPFKKFAHPVNSASTIKFDSRGIVPLNTARTICIYSDVDPEIDCLVIHCARINSGKIKNQNSACNADNCRVK